MVVGSYRDFFAATAGAAGTLTGLLFVALSVASSRGLAPGPGVILQVRAAAALLAFSNALSVSLFSLVPSTNAGYPAVVLGVIGILFTAAAIRSILSSQATPGQKLQQLGLITLLLLIFGTELVSGIVLIASPGRSSAVQVIGYALAASLLVGIARAWEFVGERNTGILASIAVLTGHTPAPDSDPAPEAAASPEPDDSSRT